MKALFLDIDGVIKKYDRLHPERIRTEGLINFDHDCISRVEKIISLTGAKVVLSSSWRILGIEKHSSLSCSFKENRAEGIYKHIVDTTRLSYYKPDGSRDDRDDQILDWVKDHCPITWAALDDWELPKLGSRLVRTDRYVGVTDDDVNKAVELLNS